MSFGNAFLDLVNEAKTQIKEINIDQLKQLKEKNIPFHLFDVREESEWAQGHIPGAEYLGKGIIERDIEGVVPNMKDTIVLYCGGGYRSALAAYNLQKMGYENVISLDGGYRAWKCVE
jgi:rhodanese-related sulfurtransferase